jgi:monoamine oxidase
MSNPLVSLSRRAFIASASAAAIAGSAASETLGGGSPTLYDVVVVGAGLAGLHSAGILEDMGLKVCVVEATDRVGGRLRTGRTEDGYRAELGASEVGALYGRVRDACRRFNIGLSNVGPVPTHFMLRVNGQNVRPENWESSTANMMLGDERKIAPYLIQNKMFFDWLPFENPADWLDPKYFEHDVSAAAYMRARGVSEEAIRLANFDVNAPSLDSVSAMSIFRDLARLKMEGFMDPDKPQYGVNENVSSYIEGGSDMLPKAMAAALNGPVLLNSPVAAVDQAGNEVETRLTSGERIRSKFMVMAAPLTGVRNIRFTPGLPRAVSDSAFGAQYSGTTQFHFRVKRPFWEEDGLAPSIWSDTLFERAFVISNGGGEHGSMIVWLNGDGSTMLQAMSMEAQQQVILAELAKARPAIKGALEPTVSYSWNQNPFVGGNKHVFGAGQVKSFAADMGQPHGRIHFAGEHLRRIEPGMESAMETAEIAVLNILDKI